MATREKIAVPLDFQPSIVALNNGERMTRKEAKAKGWKIYGEPDEVATPKAGEDSLRAHKVWRSTILGMPEARERESAAVEIVTTQNRETMTIESARAFLRGLPTEQTQEETSMPTNDTDPRAARLAEIEGGMKAFNKGNGHGARANATPSRSSLAGMDQSRLRRLAEIRLNALENNVAHEASAGETKKLRYALQVTGMELSAVFAQLAVDTSKLRI
jgi:hypothetical protein